MPTIEEAYELAYGRLDAVPNGTITPDNEDMLLSDFGIEMTEARECATGRITAALSRLQDPADHQMAQEHGWSSETFVYSVMSGLWIEAFMTGLFHQRLAQDPDMEIPRAVKRSPKPEVMSPDVKPRRVWRVGKWALVLVRFP